MDFTKIEKHTFSRGSISKHVDFKNGIYIYFDKHGTPLYVGKSKSLKNRMKSYTADKLAPKTAALIAATKYFSTIEVASEIEALLLEGLLIGTLKPRYNIELKDDKHPLYIIITKEHYPRVLTARKEEKQDIPIAHKYGPFPSSYAVRIVLKTLRRVFPYAEHTPGSKACLYSQIGLCDPCPSLIAHTDDPDVKKKLTREYKKNIRRIRDVLEGKMLGVKEDLLKEMNSLSRKLEFEKAKKIKDTISQLDYVTQPITPAKYFLTNPNLLEDIRSEEVQQLSAFLTTLGVAAGTLSRIECYDIAHLAGTAPTASMVTFIDGEAEKSLYRHFRIRSKKGNDDYASMREVASRRKKYLKAWGKPDLIIVDGGKGQVSSFGSFFASDDIPVVGIAKRLETIIVPQDEGFVSARLPQGPARNLVQRIRDESHRFARRYHAHLLKTKVFG